ncbi:MAG: tetratricopeptide repeat protein, partial [Planctomycetota bacterium]
MKRLPIIAAFVAVALWGVQGALAQSGHDLFQKGLIQEHAEGDLDKAIGLYKLIIENFSDDRPLVAKAILQMGGCYEKLVDQEAAKAYQRLIMEFADQAEAVRSARLHLQRLGTAKVGTDGNGPTYSLVLDDQIAGVSVDFRYFSPSGDRIVFRNSDKTQLYIADPTGTKIQPLLDDLG